MRLACLAVLTFLGFSACGENTLAGTDALAAGWTAKLDEADATNEPGRFVAKAGSLEVKPGPNATLWHADHRASGAYRLSADVTHLDSGLHPHGAGLVFGGTDVHADKQAYTYFLVRGDGHFLIKTRAGAETTDVVPWSRHSAAALEDDAGVTHNRLTVDVGAVETAFAINGTEVHRLKTSGLPTDGRFGFRLVHDLHVRFGEPAVATN